MKRLVIAFNDNSKAIITMKDRADHIKYLNGYTKSRIKSAVLQKYPKKDNEPEILI